MEWLNRLWERFSATGVEREEANPIAFEESDFIRNTNGIGFGLFDGESDLFREAQPRGAEEVFDDWLDELDGGNLRR